MLHIYRQVSSLQDYRTFVMTKAVQNAELFPFSDIEMIPKPPCNPLRHGWLKLVQRRPPIVYRGEYQMLARLLERRGADLMHIYFGHTGTHLLPFIERWDKPCVVSFHGADVAKKNDIRDYDAKLRKLFDAVPLVLARSQSLAERLVSLGCPPEKLRINRTGVPLQEFPYVRREAPVDGHWRLLQACRLIPKKGVATTLCAFAIFQKGFPNAELVIAGKGPLARASRRTRGGTGRHGQGSFPRFPFAGGIARTLRAVASFPASERNAAGPKPGRHSQFHSGSDVDRLAGGGDAARRNSGSGRARPLRVAGGGARFRSAGRRDERNRALARHFPRNGLLGSEWVAANFEQSAQIRQLESHYDEAVALAAARAASSRARAATGRRVLSPNRSPAK